jgi:hypothetical protein
MIRIDNSTAVGTRPTITAAGTQGFWTNGDVPGAIPATILEADWFNDLDANIEALFDAGGITGTKGPGGDTDLLDALNAIIASAAYRGHPIALLERVGPAELRFRPIVGASIYIPIDGVIRSQASALSWDMVADIEGSEAAKTWYYLYVEWTGSALGVKISATAPDPPGGTKPGYHPSTSGFVCVGQWPNDTAQNLVDAAYSNGWLNLSGSPADFQYDLGTTFPTAWTQQALFLPETCYRIKANAALSNARSAYGMIGEDRSLTALPNGSNENDGFFDEAGYEDITHGIGSNSSGFIHGSFEEFELTIIDPTAPAFKWGLVDLSGDSGGANDFDFRVKAINDLYGPRF